MRDFHPRPPHDAVEGLARHAHAPGRLAVIEVFDVREPDRLELIGAKYDFRQIVERNARRFEKIAGGLVGDAAGAKRAWHGETKLAPGGNEHTLITSDGLESKWDYPPRSMKIALPLTAADEFSPHYGAAAKFVVFEVDPARRAVQRRLVVVPQASEPCAWPTFLRAAGVDLVLAGGMGRGARAHMAEHGLGVLVGVPTAAPDALIDAWMAGALTSGANPCDGSGHGADRHEDRDHAGHCHCAH